MKISENFVISGAFCGLKKNIINRHFHFGQNSFAPAEEEIVD
jgi:hypothetical protein